MIEGPDGMGDMEGGPPGAPMEGEGEGEGNRMYGGYHYPPYNPYRSPCFITDCPRPGTTQPKGPPPTLPSPSPSPWWG